MSFLNLQASYFKIEDPRRVLERWFNRFRYCRTVRINQREVEVKWTARAEREMRHLEQGLVVELQLYFSCVIKKRALFHAALSSGKAARMVPRTVEIDFRQDDWEAQFYY
jgi:hypothetical protein